MEGNNRGLIAANDILEKENAIYVKKITETIQKIDINNLLKDIDVEELRLIANNNKQMNFVMQNLVTKWNYIVGPKDKL